MYGTNRSRMKQGQNHKPLNKQKLASACRELAKADSLIASVHQNYGTPPLWDRPAGFATLLQIILEQQVSLASAKACFAKLAGIIGDVCPERLLKLSDTQLKTIGFSRQKTSYARHLSQAVIDGGIDIEGLQTLPDDAVTAELTKLKGVGKWTADIYLLMAMLRPDVIPRGDLALHIAWQKLSGAVNRPDTNEFVAIAERWRPYRSVAARLLWHFYLSQRERRP